MEMSAICGRSEKGKDDNHRRFNMVGRVAFASHDLRHDLHPFENFDGVDHLGAGFWSSQRLVELVDCDCKVVRCGTVLVEVGCSLRARLVVS